MYSKVKLEGKRSSATLSVDNVAEDLSPSNFTFEYIDGWKLPLKHS